MKEHPERPIFGPEDPRLDPANPPEVKRWRSIAKAVTWRAVGTLDTLVLSFIILTYLAPLFGFDGANLGENLQTASYIAITEVATKMTLFYLHERAWERTQWDIGLDDEGHRVLGHKRTAAKTTSWRVIASLDTFLLALIFTGNPATAVSIGGFEIITKLVLYYLHERAWSKVKFGIERLD
jgi:uncharacterized membrane protein